MRKKRRLSTRIPVKVCPTFHHFLPWWNEVKVKKVKTYCAVEAGIIRLPGLHLNMIWEGQIQTACEFL